MFRNHNHVLVTDTSDPKSWDRIFRGAWPRSAQRPSGEKNPRLPWTPHAGGFGVSKPGGLRAQNPGASGCQKLKWDLARGKVEQNQTQILAWFGCLLAQSDMERIPNEVSTHGRRVNLLKRHPASKAKKESGYINPTCEHPQKCTCTYFCCTSQAGWAISKSFLPNNVVGN